MFRLVLFWINSIVMNSNKGFLASIFKGVFILIFSTFFTSCADFHLGSTNKQVHVNNEKQLLEVLMTPSTVPLTIKLASNVTYDMTHYKELELHQGYKLIGDKNNKPIILSKEIENKALFITRGDGVEIEGINFIGPDPEINYKLYSRLIREKNFYSRQFGRGVQVEHKNVIVRDCEFSGWSHAAVFVLKGGYATVIDNYFHENQRHGLGYGVCVHGAGADIKRNIFKNNRHHIASSGVKGSYYEASYNKFYDCSSHAVDVHGGKDRKDNTDLAGDYINVHNNTFYFCDQEYLVIRGTPAKVSYFQDNIFPKCPDRKLDDLIIIRGDRNKLYARGNIVE